MARSKDLVTWEDCPPAIQNGVAGSYDSRGVFSGSIVSRLIEGRRVLFLFYTSISALPIHWSEVYIEGCESQSVAFSTDFGRSWHRYENNPLLRKPPKQSLTTGWRDPFVSKWESCSNLLGVDRSTDYMLIASGERGCGPQLHLYSSNNLLEWKLVSSILDVEDGAKVSHNSALRFGKNFECASFFTLDGKDYLIVGVEEDIQSTRHNNHYNMWLCGKLIMNDGSLNFEITSHGLLDHGVLYATHIFRDANNRLLQLGWADETAKQLVVKKQGWAGCLTHSRELYQISLPINVAMREEGIWDDDEVNGMMTTLGIRPASQLEALRPKGGMSSLRHLKAVQSTNYEIEATFKQLSGNEKLSIGVREAPKAIETTKIILNVEESTISVDRTDSSLENLGSCSTECGPLNLHAGEDLHVHIFVDESIVEVFANDRFALTSRIYPSLETSRGVSCDFGDFDERNVEFQLWEGLSNAWPGRRGQQCTTQNLPQFYDLKELSTKERTGSLVKQSLVSA